MKTRRLGLLFVSYFLILFVLGNINCSANPDTISQPSIDTIRQALIVNTNGIIQGKTLNDIVLPVCTQGNGSALEYSASYGLTGLPAWLNFDSTTRTVSLHSDYAEVPYTAIAKLTVTYMCAYLRDTSITASRSFDINDLDGGGVPDGREYQHGAIPLLNLNGWFYLTPDNYELYRVGTDSFKIPTTITKIITGMDPTDHTDDILDPDGDNLTSSEETANGTNLFVKLSEGTFDEVDNYAANNGIEGIINADFNNDLNLDIAATNKDDDDITILLGDGDGTFTAGDDVTTGNSPRGIVSADFDEDGNMDLAVVNSDDDNVEILLGEGDGTFVASTNPATGESPAAITAADFDNDGSVDLAITNSTDSANTLSILLGDGDGTFTDSGENPATGSVPFGIIAADFDADGNMDLAITNYGDSGAGTTMSVFIGSGDGTFVAKVDYTTETGPISLSSADFNNDGYLDIANVNINSRSVSIFLGIGDGTFQDQVSSSTGADETKNGPTGIAIADFNGDANMDVAVSNYGLSIGKTISILLGIGDGTFDTKTYYDVASNGRPSGITAGDFETDGDIDLATANYAASSISVLLNE